MSAHVYFVATPDAIKIGFTRVPRAALVHARIRELQVGCDRRLRLLYAVPGARLEETALHRAFRFARLHHEWFERASVEPFIMQSIDEILAGLLDAVVLGEHLMMGRHRAAGGTIATILRNTELARLRERRAEVSDSIAKLARARSEAAARASLGLAPRWPT